MPPPVHYHQNKETLAFPILTDFAVIGLRKAQMLCSETLLRESFAGYTTQKQFYEPVRTFL